MATAHKGTSTGKGKRPPGSLVCPGAQFTPRKRKIADRMAARPNGTALRSITGRANGEGVTR